MLEENIADAEASIEDLTRIACHPAAKALGVTPGKLVALDAEIGRTWRVRSFAGDLGDVPRDALNWTRSEGRPSRWLMRDERIGLIATVIPRWHQPRELPPGGYGSARRLHVPRQR